MILKRYNIITVFNFIISFQFYLLNAQDYDPSSFFPLHIGDQWQYKQYGIGDPKPDRFRSIIGDTLDSLGVQWYQYDVNGSINHIRISDSLVVYIKYKLHHNNQTAYKLDAEIGDCWDVTQGGGAYVIIDAIYPRSFFGEERMTMKLDSYSGFCDSLHLESLYMGSDFLSIGLGRVESWYHPYSGEYLIGAIIDSVRYGTFLHASISNQYMDTPTKFLLYQNYPNPFNSITNFNFSVKRSGFIEIHVYDLLGNKVTTLNNKYLEPGIFNSSWDGTNSLGENVSSGVYILGIHYGRQIQTQKMILAK